MYDISRLRVKETNETRQVTTKMVTLRNSISHDRESEIDKDLTVAGGGLFYSSPTVPVLR